MGNLEMMRGYLDLIKAGQFVEAEQHYADDVRVHVKGHNAISGDYVGHADYTEALGRLMGMVDSLTVEEHDLLVGNDHAVVLSVWHVTKGDASAALNQVIVYHLTDGKISELWIIPEDSEKNAALLS